MTIIEVAQELQKDDRKRFRLPHMGDWTLVRCGDDLMFTNSMSGLEVLAVMDIPNLLATDWEEVK